MCFIFLFSYAGWFLTISNGPWDHLNRMTSIFVAKIDVVCTTVVSRIDIRPVSITNIKSDVTMELQIDIRVQPIRLPHIMEEITLILLSRDER